MEKSNLEIRNGKDTGWDKELYRDRNIRKDERRKIALEIMRRFNQDAPLPTNAENLLQFTKGVNSERESFVDFAWELGNID